MQYRTYQREKFDWFADSQSRRPRTPALKSPLGVHSFDKGVAVSWGMHVDLCTRRAIRTLRKVAVVLDARHGTRGSVELQVLVDGKEQKIGDGKPRTYENGPWRVKVDVARAEELTRLKVLWGEGGNVGVFVNWCDAWLIRTAR